MVGTPDMTRRIIDEDEGYPIAVNTFWGGEDGECVQLTVRHLGVMEGKWARGEYDSGITTMTRKQAIQFFSKALKRLKTQAKRDRRKPPWWQVLAKRRRI